MFSLIKGQVIKPFLKFTKNLSPDQINLSVLKGEGELKSLELEETTLMELLDLPTWLYLRKAQCSNISFKIRWTKLETHPVSVVIDRVDVELEALDEPRPETDQMFASYRTGSGKYKLADKVVDGASILINSVFIQFHAQAFQASIELSRLTVVSKTPKWQNGALNLTSLSLPAGDAVLIFKEISWDSVRLVADGLLTELNGIPVKLITNTGRIRLTLKKRLSDSALISTRIQLILDDLLWVLTLSQVEAAIVFLRSLKRSVLLAARQSRQYAESRAKRQTLGWQTTTKPPSNPTPTVKRDKLCNMDQYSLAARIFHRYDVLETSYHFCIHRTEIHFCDETRECNQLSQIVVPNGYIKVHVYGLELDWYPYHVEPSPQARWHGSRDFREARDNWLTSLNRAHFSYPRPVPPADPLLNVPTNPSSPFSFSSSVVPTLDLSVIQSVFILRIRDLDVSRVSFPNNDAHGSKYSDSSTVPNRFRYPGEELPSAAHLFLASDKKLHCLSENTNLITVELRVTYRPLEQRCNFNRDQTALPCILFAQLKPLYLRFDTDTVIWLNAFLLTLHVNLAAFAKPPAIESWLNNDLETNNYESNATALHIRCEALMPRIILPFRDPEQNRATVSPTGLSPAGPDALIILLDQVIIQLLTPPLNQTAASVLEQLLAKQAGTSALDDLTTDKGRDEAKSHIPVDTSRFSVLAASCTSTDLSSIKLDLSDQYWCVHCPHVWAQFLTVVEVLDAPVGKRAALGRTKLSLYRQSLLEPVPITIWASVSSSTATKPMEPPLQLLIDCDCPTNPLDTDRRGFFDHSDKPKPMSLFLGHVPPLSGGLYWLPAGNQRLPDALDQFLFLCDLLDQLSRVKDQLALDLNRISNPPSILLKSENDTTSKFLYSLAFVVRNRIELHIVPPDSMSHQVNHTEKPSFTVSNTQQSIRDQLQQQQLLTTDRCSECPTYSSSKSHFPLMNERAGLTEQLDIPVGLQHTKEPSFPLLTKSRQVDNVSMKSCSTSDITAVSGDLDNLNVTDVQDNWLSTYEVLFRLEDDLKDSDSASISSASGYVSGSRRSPLIPKPQEVGTELFETDSTRSSQPSASNMGRSSRLSQRSCEDRNQRETTCQSETTHEQSSPLTIIVQVDGLVGEMDGTDIEMRTWLKIGPIHLACQNGIQDCATLHRQLSNPVPSAGYSWSVFASVLRQLIHSSSEDLGDEPSYQTSTCLHADLLTNWSLRVPKIILQTMGQLLRCFNARGGLDQLQSMLPTGTLLRDIISPVITIDANLHLKRGMLTVEIEPSPTDPSQPIGIIRKIQLQQGLSLVLNKDAILRIGLSEAHSWEMGTTTVKPNTIEQTTEDEVNASEITHVQVPPSSGQSGLLRQYQRENMQLKENIRRLNSTISELNIELATVRHMLDLMQTR